MSAAGCCKAVARLERFAAAELALGQGLGAWAGSLGSQKLTCAPAAETRHASESVVMELQASCAAVKLG